MYYVTPKDQKEEVNMKSMGNQLLEEWYRQTKCPLLLNTSFNLKGEAIVETLNDAIDTVNRSDIDTLYVPE